MSWLDKFYDKKVKGFELFLTHSTCYRLYAKDNESGEVIFLKNFVSKEDYERFMVEAVVMHLICKRDFVLKARNAWKNMLNFCRDKSRKLTTFLFLVFFSFGLTGCQLLSQEIEHSKGEVVTIKGDIYSCEYHKGLTVNCKKEKTNEKN